MTQKCDLYALLHQCEPGRHANLDLRHALLGFLAHLGAPDGLLALLSDIHAATWFTIDGSSLCETKRGTRPGSPLADLVYHVLMVDIVHDLESWLLDRPQLQQVLTHMGITMPCIVWADDLAITWATRTAAEVIPALQALFVQARSTFSRRALQLNCKRGKTAAVVSFVGPGFPPLRQEYQLVPDPTVPCVLQDGSVLHLCLMASYRHLGSMYTAAHDLDVELSYRLGTAWTAFQAMAKPLFCNRHLPVGVRLRLFHALVASRLFFGFGAWYNLSNRQFVRLRSALARMLGRLFRLGSKTSLSHRQILAKAGFGDIRNRLAVDRLLYAQHVFCHAPAFLQHLLLIEGQRLAIPNSWLSGLKEGVAWLASMDPRIPASWAEDLTDLFTVWQSPGTRWKRQVKRACNCHVLQESMMLSVHHLHDGLYRLFIQHGAEFTVDPLDFDGIWLPLSCATVAVSSLPPKGWLCIVTKAMAFLHLSTLLSLEIPVLRA